MESILVKISGNVVDDPEQLTQLAVWLTQQQAKGRSFVVVHGAGKQMNLYSERMGLDVNMLEGRRVTNKETLELITGVMGGIVNKTIVDRFRRHSISAVGLSGADATISTAHKRAPLSINGEMVDFGYVGEIDHMDTSLIKALIQSEHIPVIASLTWSPKDGILNVNADTFANRLALALQCSSMIALMDVPAVRDAFGVDLPGLNKLEFEQGVAEGWIKDGMIPKLTSAFAAIDNGLPQIVLTNVDGLLLGKGTTLQAISS